MKKLKVMLVARRDNGLGHDMAKALNYAGCDAELYLHPYNLSTIAQKADVIQFLHSDYLNLGISLQRKACAVLHSGMAYRKDPERLNDIFNPITRLTLIQTADLMGLGATNEFYWPGLIDTDEIKPEYYLSGYHAIGHIPERYCGTEIIRNILTRHPEWKYVESMDDCEIFFDACCLAIGNMVYGEWGLRALKAAATGKIVITHSLLGQKMYRKEYGDCALWIANSPKAVAECVSKAMALSGTELNLEQRKTRDWVEAKHSLPVMGMLLRQKYEEIL
jgi:hypothetical protein